MRERLHIVQALRGLAALAVTVFHARLNYPSTEDLAWFDRLTTHAGAGVDLFFAISGFIMVYTTHAAKGSGRDAVQFFAKRLTRLWPVYAVLTLIYFGLMSAAFASVGASYPHGLGDLVKSLLFIPLSLEGNAPFYGSPVLGTGWTLNYEVYFYIAFGVSLLFAGVYRWTLLLLWVISTLVLLPFFAGGPAPHQGYLNIVMSPLIWEFVGGVLIGLLYVSGVQFPSARIGWVVASLSVILFIGWLFSPLAATSNRLFSWGVPTAVLLGVLVLASKTVEFRVPRSLVWLGNVSFSLYLVHPIVFNPLSVIIWQSPYRWMTEHLWFVGVTVAVSLLAAQVSYLVLERGLSERVRRSLLSAIRRAPLPERASA